MKRILIVEPHRILREALVTALNRQSGFEVGAQSGSVAEAGRAVALGDTEVALINPALPGGDGLACVRELSQAPDQIPVLVLTESTEPTVHALVREAGARHTKEHNS